MIYEHYLRAYAQRFAALERNMWNYEDGCVLIGLHALAEATGDDYYIEALQAFTDRYITEDGEIRCYRMEEYNIDFIPAGRVLFYLYEKTGEIKYRQAIEKLEEQLRHHPRTNSGNFWHKKIYPYQVWLDGLYMGQPFYIAYENLFGDGSNYDDIMNQFRNVKKHLYDENTHLYYHAWDESRKSFWCDKETGLSAGFWTRAIGWYLMALADVYDLMPEERTADREELAREWKTALDGMLEWQDERSGLFYQVPNLPDKEGNYLETSGSFMVAYSLFKGTRLGVLQDEKYGHLGKKIMLGIEFYRFYMKNDSICLGGICKGAGLGPEGNFRRDGSVEYYLSEEVVSDEQKGAGVCMMAYAEYLRYNQNCKSAKEYPKVNIFNKGYDPIMPDEIRALEKAGKKL